MDAYTIDTGLVWEENELPRYYVEHYPPLLYHEHDLEGFASLAEAEEFARDCARGGECARVFGELGRHSPSLTNATRLGREYALEPGRDYPASLLATLQGGN